MKTPRTLRHALIDLTGKKLTPNRWRHLVNAWPLLVAMGVRITHIEDDWSGGRVELKLNRLNANLHGTAFGGTLFAMTDLLFGTLVMQRLGFNEYEAWTRTGSFEYIKPGSRGSYLNVEVSDELVAKIKKETEGGYSTIVPGTSVIRNRRGEIVGIGQQDLYVRRRGKKKPPANPEQFEHLSGEALIGTARTLARLGILGDDRREVLRDREKVARRCITPEARAVAWLEGVLDGGSVSLDQYRAAGLPEVVIEALISEYPSAPARELLDEVAESKRYLNNSGVPSAS